MAYPRLSRARSFVKARRTAGDLTLNSTSWANVDTGLDLTLDECQEGDEIVYHLNGLAGNEATALKLDVVTLVSGSPSRSFVEAGAVVASPGKAIAGWLGNSGAYTSIAGASRPYTLVAGDIVSGSVTLRLRYATSSATNKTLFGGASYPLDVWAENRGPAQG